MKILFDENVPHPLKSSFVGHDVSTVQGMGWAGVENGDLLKQAEGRFEVLLLADKNLRYQQALTGYKIALVELPTNRWPILQAMSSQIMAAVEGAKPGDYIILDLPAP